MKPPETNADDSDRKPTIFLSYARADQKRARRIISLLETIGCSVWWDGLLEGGDNFLPTTEAMLESADAIVVLWSKTSIDSHWVRDEATRGRERSCLVPISIDGARPPLGFRQFQVIDFSKSLNKSDTLEVDALARAVGALNKAPQISPIQTGVEGVNRRLLIGGAIATVAAGAGLTGWSAGWFRQAGSNNNSIAVTPFKNLSGNPEQDYFSDGLSEELRTSLSRNRLLRVSAPTSSSSFRDVAADVITIARKLSVAFVIRGSVRRDGAMLRIAAELLDGETAVVSWAQTYDRKLVDVFALQTEVADAVSNAISRQLSAIPLLNTTQSASQTIGGTTNISAFDAYLRGRALAELSIDEASNRLALAQYDLAIAVDPTYAAAHAAKSKILAVIANQTGNTDEIRKLYDLAIASARYARTLAPDLAEAHSALGYALYNGNLDPGAARLPYERSRQLGGGQGDILRSFALYCAYRGRRADASEAIQRTLMLDPINPRVFLAASYVAYAARDYAQTIEFAHKALRLNPNLSSANYLTGNALYQLGRVDEAQRAYGAEQVSLFGLQGIAISSHRLGEPQKAKAAFAKLIAEYGSNSSYQQVQVLAQWQQIDAAITTLAEAVRVRDSGLLLAKTDPMLDPLRSRPEYNELLSGVGLT